MALHRSNWLLITLTITLSSGCLPRKAPAEPTPVARGLRFSSHNAAFDAFFADLHDLQVQMMSLPERERNLRKELAQALKIDDGATTNLLSERAGTMAQGFRTKGAQLKLDIEGLEAVDEADTSAQMRVSGSLDPDGLHYAEAITRTVRAELKLLARLNALQQTLQRMSARSNVLEGEVERAFASDPARAPEVRRNLGDSKLMISMMDEKRVDLAVEVRRVVERLASAATTNATLAAPNEAPLVTFVKAEREKDASRNTGRSKPPAPAATRTPSARSPAEKPAAPTDFEP